MSHEPKHSEDPGSLRRGNFTYFPVIPGRLEFAIELRRAILARSARHRRRGAARLARRRLPAGPRAIAGDVGDPLSRSAGRRARHLRSRGAVRSVHRSRPHRPRSGCRSHLHRARLGRPAAPSRCLSRSLFHPLHRPGQIRRGLSRLSAGAQRRDRGARRRHGVEAARRRSAGAGVRGRLAESAGPAARRHGSARRIRPASASRPRSACSIRIRIAWPKSPSNIRICRIATKRFALEMEPDESDRPAQGRSSICCARPKKNTSRTPATRSNTGSAA